MNSRFVGLGCVGIPMRIPIHKLTSSLLAPRCQIDTGSYSNEACIYLAARSGLGGSELRRPPSLLMLFLSLHLLSLLPGHHPPISPSYSAREPDRHSSSSELHVAGLLHHALLGSSRGSPPPGAARAVAAHEGDGNKCRQRLHRVAAEASAPIFAGGSVHDDDRGDGARDGRRR